MSTMSQPIEPVDRRVPLFDARPTVLRKITADVARLKTPLRILASLLLSPALVLLAFVGFLVVLADFAWFRLRDLRDGHPSPKRLWEF